MARKRSKFHGLALAIGFCTRIAPTRPDVSSVRAFEFDLASSMAWFPFVGMLIGLVMILPWWLGLIQNAPWLQAWGALAISVWLTKALHWDGLADLADGWGSNKQGDAFWTILKDSHSGFFAVLAVALFVSGQVLVFHEILASKAWAALVWCPVLGRCAIPALAMLCKKYPRPGMGRSFILAAGWEHMFFPVVLALIAGQIISYKAVGLGIMLLFICLLRMRGLARKNRGCNGDFLGASVICGELCAGLGWVLVQ